MFSVSVCAQEVDGNTVYTYWYIDNVEDLTLFDNTIVSLTAPNPFYITSSIILSEPISANTLFNLDIGIETDAFADYPVEVTFGTPNSTVAGSASVNLVDSRVIINSLQFDYDVSKIFLKFYVTYPSWTVVNTIYDVNIDGTNYNYEKNQTWSSWCASNYNILGLYVDNGCIYYGDSLTGKILKCGNVNVQSSDLVDKDKTYYLEQLEVAPTIINFYIGSNECTADVDMTWEAWLNSDYNTLGLIADGTSIYTSDKTTILSNNEIPILKTDKIIEGTNYTLSTYEKTIIFYCNGIGYQYVDGMTWDDWLVSRYNVDGFTKIVYDSYYAVYDSEGIRIYNINSFDSYHVTTDVKSTDKIMCYSASDPWGSIHKYHYGTKNYVTQLESGSSVVPFSARQYEFDFAITSVNVTIQDEGGLLNGIIAWLKKVVDSITELPGKIVNGIGEKLTAFGTWIVDQIKGLFIPSEESIIELKTKFEELLRDRFGAVYDSADIIDDFASSFSYTETDPSVTFPTVTVNLAGTDFTFGGWEVDVIPDRFEGIVDVLKLLISMVATVFFVNALRKRLEDILE